MLVQPTKAVAEEDLAGGKNVYTIVNEKNRRKLKESLYLESDYLGQT